MKQVSYEFDWTHILPSIVSHHEIENGFWKVEIIAETMAGSIPRTVEGQINATLPGYVVRMWGFKLVSAPGWGPMTIYVEDGTVSYASDTDQRGPEESSGSPGGNPGPIATGF